MLRPWVLAFAAARENSSLFYRKSLCVNRYENTKAKNTRLVMLLALDVLLSEAIT